MINRRRRSASSLARSPSSFSNDSVIVTYVGRPSGNSHYTKQKTKILVSYGLKRKQTMKLY